MADEQNGNVDRGRIVSDYKHSIIQSVEHDEMQHGDTAAMREQYDERTRQLDENEAVCKGEYDSNHCEEVTGLSSDGYRRQVIEDYTREQMAGKSAEESRQDDYWDDPGKNQGAESSSTMESVQDEQADYWAENSAATETANERENENANEASC